MDRGPPITSTSHRLSQGVFSHRCLRKASAANTVITGLEGSAGIAGLAPSATEAEWMALAGDNSRARNGMARLHSLFKDAPILGSLINPRALAGDLIEAEFHELAP